MIILKLTLSRNRLIYKSIQENILDYIKERSDNPRVIQIFLNIRIDNAMGMYQVIPTLQNTFTPIKY